MSKENPTLSETLTSIKDSYNQYVLQPINSFGLAGFIFDIDGETSMQLQADITDHYIENNSTIQDHIAIKPLKVILKNYVGELSYTPSSTSSTVKKVVAKLVTLSSYLPTLTTAAQQLKDSFSTNNTFQNITQTPADLWSLVKNLNPFATKQQQAYQYFKSLMEQRILVSLQTPYEFIQSMAIESIMAIQPEDSVSITNFSITLKKMRFTKSLVSSAKANISKLITPQGRSLLQSTDIISKGKANGISVSGIFG